MILALMPMPAGIVAILHGSYHAITGFIRAYGYEAIFLLLVIEAASIPIPSEVTLPVMGFLAAAGFLNLYAALVVALVGSAVGMAIDYYIAYFFEKDVVYKHLALFHVSKAQLKRFDEWFTRNGPFTVFITRLLPVVRGLINFPAGFAKMQIGKFYAYSMVGVVIWEVVLVMFGYYALRVNIYVTSLAVAIFAVVIYLLYRFAKTKM